MSGVLKIGEKIKGKYDEYEVYRIAGGAGKSGMGVVYICYALKQGLPVALKTFQKFESREAQEMFRREALIWVGLERYPYIVRAYWVEEIGGQLVIVLEYVAPDKGGRNTLSHYLREISLADSLKFAIQFCYGMEYAYSKGMKVHRDIKPDNIMVTQDKMVKITDFGLATALGKAEIGENAEFGMQNAKGIIGLSVFHGGTGWGTRPYMSPEQFEGKEDRRSDIYSFGVVLYQMASGGKLPFVGRTRKEYYELHKSGRIPPLASPLFPIIERCLRRRSPEFEDFPAIRKELEKLLYQETGEGIQPPKIEALEVEELSNKGLALADLGKYNEAIICYDKALEINPRYAEAWNNKGGALAKLGKHNEAIICLDKALEINPRDNKAWNNKGVALDALGKRNEAIYAFERFIEFASPHLAGYVEQIKMVIRQIKERGYRKIEEGIAPRKIKEVDVSELNNKGNALAKLGRHNEAIICYDKALEINPGFAEAWYNKGITLAALGRQNEAIICYNKVLEINPGDAEAWYNKGLALAKLAK